MDTNQLIQAQRAAHAAWLACPARTRADKARKAELEAALSAAAQAVAAAKRAAEAPAQAGGVSVGELADRMLARQAGNAAAEQLDAAVHRAAGMYMRANDYPRCLEGWPCGAIEMAADRLLRENSAIAERYL